MFIRPSKTDADFHRPRPPHSRRQHEAQDVWSVTTGPGTGLNRATYDADSDRQAREAGLDRFRSSILTSMGLAEQDLHGIAPNHRERIERLIERESVERNRAEARRDRDPQSRPTPEEMDGHFKNAFVGLAELDQFLEIFDPVEVQAS